MSLINDAIKRAGQTPPAPSTPTQTAAGLRPVEYQRTWRFPWALVLLILVPVFGLAIWFIAKGWELSKAPRSASAELVANARTQPAVHSTSADAATAGFQVPQAVVVTQAVAVREGATAAVPLSADPAKPAFPNLKLQGIYWRPARPSAVINSKTVYIGDKVEGARVTAMDQESVTVQWQSESKVLTLP